MHPSVCTHSSLMARWPLPDGHTETEEGCLNTL